jgi:hypothetical protein
MAREQTMWDRRKYVRVPVDFPVAYIFKGKRLLGKAINASNEGMMIDSFLGLDSASRILRTLLAKNRDDVDLKFTFGNVPYRTQGEMRHFRLHFFGREPLRVEMGFFIPKMR